MSGTLEAGRAAGTAGRRPSPLRSILSSPIDPATWRANWSIFLGFWVGLLGVSALGACFSTGGGLLIWLVGFALIGLGIEVCRLVARAERWRMTLTDPRPLVPHPYRPLHGSPGAPYGPWLRATAEAELLDESRWRDVVYVIVVCPLAVFEAGLVLTLWAAAIGLIASPIVLAGLREEGLHPLAGVAPIASAWLVGAAVLAGLILVPVAALTARGAVLLHRAVVEALLCIPPEEALRRDVERLRGSRTAALELEASELRRIERDLHDGAQQRLVALAIDLGRAEDRIETDPAGARLLVASAREQARLALVELRGLVRGAAPAILLDRGLMAALAAVAGGCPVPTSVDGDLGPGERLPASIERAAYFVVAESLANVAKHSSASRCEVIVRRGPAMLAVEVRDDGAGGAAIVPAGGLAGLRDRVEALDGTLDVSSPEGGPTVVRAQLPMPGADTGGPDGAAGT